MSTASKSNRTTHTPGPWTWEPGDEVISTHDGLTYVAWLPSSEAARKSRVVKADARLIAAAPELYEALTKAHHELNEIRARDGVPYTHQGIQASVDDAYFGSVVDECRAALAKAEGRS